MTDGLHRIIHLTATECRVWELIVQGARDAEVAFRLGITKETARKHRGNIRAKLVEYGRRKRLQEGISATIGEIRRQDEQRGRQSRLIG